MKLIRPPVCEVDKIEIREMSYVADDEEDNFLSMTAFYQMFPRRKKPVVLRSFFYAGRKTYSDCEIDFEDEHDDTLRIFTMMLDIHCSHGTKRDINVDGFALKGVFPMQHLGGSTWRCSIDYFERIFT